MKEKSDLLLKIQFGNWTSEKEKVSDAEIIETFSGDIVGQIRTILNTDGKPVLIEGTLNNITIRKTYTYNADGSITVTQEVK